MVRLNQSCDLIKYFYRIYYRVCYFSYHWHQQKLYSISSGSLRVLSLIFNQQLRTSDVKMFLAYSDVSITSLL